VTRGVASKSLFKGAGMERNDDGAIEDCAEAEGAGAGIITGVKE
jgi:hypothetical protein